MTFDSPVLIIRSYYPT